MFGKKKEKSEIDKEQLELIQNAQRRIKQKKRLFIHFVMFLIGALFLILANTVLGIGKDVQFFGKEWFLYAILIWLFFFLYHLLNVFVANKFIDKKWEQQQLDKLVAKQQDRIDELKQKLLKEEEKIAQNQIAEESSEQKKKSKNTFLKKKSELTLIVAAGESNGIGKDNKLIWHLSDDLKRFKKLTSGHHIIMGRKTFESMKKPLPNRTHVVISRQKDYEVPKGVILVNTLDDALDASKKDTQPFIIGGGEIYKLAMPIAHKIELTRVHYTFPLADTFFPEIDKKVWKEMSNTFHGIDSGHEHEFSFITYIKQ